jgi:hypothetical protein
MVLYVTLILTTYAEFRGSELIATMMCTYGTDEYIAAHTFEMMDHGVGSVTRFVLGTTLMLSGVAVFRLSPCCEVDDQRHIH